MKNTDIFDVTQLEGMGTEKECERIYYSCFLLKNKKEPAQTIFCESRSSVLSGPTENPYFEDVILNLNLDFGN